MLKIFFVVVFVYFHMFYIASERIQKDLGKYSKYTAYMREMEQN